MVGFKQQNLGYGTYYSSGAGKAPNKMTRLILVGVIIAAVLGAVLFALSLFSGNIRGDLTLLAARENSLLQLANASQKTIRDDNLSTANSNAAILLASDVSSLLTAASATKLPEDLIKKEADTNGDKLKEASLLDKVIANLESINSQFTNVTLP